MKKSILFSLCVLVASGLLAQSNVSAPMNFHIVRGTIPPVLSVVPGSVQFIDEDGNGVIDANERCKIRFQVTNSGRGDGYACVAKISGVGATQGLILQNVSPPVIPKGTTQWIEIPIQANASTVTGDVTLSMYVDEPNGYGTDQIKSTIGTHRLKTPMVNVASYKIVGDQSGVLERRKPFHLQIIVQNMDQGLAENVGVEIKLPKNMNRIGGDMENITIPSLAANETRMFDYELITNQEAAENLDVQVALSEKKGYAKGEMVSLTLGQHVGSTIEMNVARKDAEVEIKRASLIADVDENIPITDIRNDKTFAVIIANENYQSVASVPFALNDGNIFYEYCTKTLGIPEKHIHLVQDATGNQLKAQVSWLETITEVYEDAHIIFYYAGHGIPDESSRTAYLLPVDGISTDISTGYKLDNLYASLGQMHTANVTIFMDACFSGSKREEGMLASARGVALKAKNGVPQGNMVVFSAAQGDETAYPDKEKQHGMFTYYLLKKLQDTRGNVTLQDLGNYISANVRKQSIVLNGKLQTPCVIPSATVGDSWQSWTLK